MQDSCIFCKIIQGMVPSSPIIDTSDAIVIKDIAPKASTHYLIIPKKHIPDLYALDANDVDLMGSLFFIAQDLGKKLSNDNSFRLVLNNGHSAGQTVFHVHIHFLAGHSMPAMMSKDL